MARALWLPDVLRDAGLTVTVEPGWETRGPDNPLVRLDAQVLVCHGTGSARSSGELPSLAQIAYRGNPGVPAPLAQAMIGRGTGRWHIVASGVSNNAGRGSWAGYSGNRRTIGIEAEHSNIADPADPRYEPWDGAIYDAYARGIAAIAEYLRLETGRACLHKEWAPHRKIDTSFDGPQFRRDVDYWRLGASPVPSPASEEDPMILPCLYPGSKAGPNAAAGGRLPYYTHDGGRLLLGWNGAAVGGDLAFPYRPLPGQPQMSSDQASVAGLTFRYREVPLLAGQRIVGLSYFVPEALDDDDPDALPFDVRRVTVYGSDGSTFTYECT